MKYILARIFPVIALLVLFSYPALAQVDNSDDRKDRIKNNLQFLFPELQNYSVTMGDLSETETPGLIMGTFTINEQQVQNFLTNEDDSQFYLLTAGPFTVNKTPDELAQAQLEREEEARAQARNTHDALMGLVGDMPVRGNPDAPVTIIEFSDFECPYCADASSIVKQVLGDHADDVKLIYVQFPLESIHPWARSASIASLCAAQQSNDAFWEMHDQYFINQDAIEVDNVFEMGASYIAGSEIEMETWETCSQDSDSDSHAAAVALLNRSISIAEQFGVSSTPGFFVNGRYISGAQPAEVFGALIEDALTDVQE